MATLNLSKETAEDTPGPCSLPGELKTWLKSLEAPERGKITEKCLFFLQKQNKSSFTASMFCSVKPADM